MNNFLGVCNMKYSAAIDLGGTNIGIGIVSEEGELVFKTSVPVEDNKNPEALRCFGAFIIFQSSSPWSS